MRGLAAVFLLPLASALTCPKNSQEFNGFCYQVVSSLPAAQAQADSYCGTKAAGSHLTSVMNAYENTYIAKYLLPAGSQAWIGGTSSGSSYSWADGLPFSYNNVNNATNGGSCLLLDTATGKWLKTDCTESHPFVCKLVEAPQPVISNSTGFQKAADYLLTGIDPTANPCEDFYQFTCGTYLKNTVLNGQSRVGIYDASQTEVNRQTAVALDAVTSSSSLTERITKAAYDACVYNYEQASVPDRSLVVYEEIKRAFGISELPLFAGSNYSPIPVSQLFAGVGYFEGTHALGTLLGSWSSVDYKNVKYNALYIDQPSLPLPRDYYVKPQFLTHMEKHVQEYAEILEMFAGDLGKSLDDATVQKLASDVVNFEIAIALASWPDEEMRNYKQMYNPYNLTALNVAYPNIDWKAYFDNLLYRAGQSSALMASNDAIISEPSYFGWLNSLFAGVQYPQATIVNYITVQAVYDSADFLASGYDKIAEKYGRVPYAMRRGKGVSRVGARQVRRKFDQTGDFCLDIIMAYMPYGPGYVYVKQIGDAGRQAVIADVTTQTVNIISSFKEMIGTLGWMSTGTKNNAYTKAGALLKNYGWPAMFSDFKNTAALDAYHQDYASIATMDKTQYWNIQLILKAGMTTRESLRLLSAPADRSNFLQSPAMVNAWYQPERNSITFPFAAFNPPYYNLQYPQAFNYGGQGGTGGHELTHGYDDEGVQFGPDGSLSDCDSFHCGWMDMNSTAGFIDMAQCVVTQFSTQCCPVKTGNVHCANGATTQGENIADLGGQQAAYRAYRKWVASHGAEEQRLPGLEEYTPNQIFWITYGFSWCMKQTTESLVSQLLTNPHAPGVCRTNNVMQDIPEFGKDFSCPRGATMFPQESGRCKVWVGQ